jgi:hypothetical protein
MPQPTEETTADDPARWLRRACASGPQVHQYIPVRFSALLALGPAKARRSRGGRWLGGQVRVPEGPCRPDSKRHPDHRRGALHAGYEGN